MDRLLMATEGEPDAATARLLSLDRVARRYGVLPSALGRDGTWVDWSAALAGQEWERWSRPQ